MKREYQKQASTEVGQPEERVVQIALPMAEILTSLEEGLGELVRKVGRPFIESVLEAEVEQIAGVRSRRLQTRQAYRWGVEQGSCLIDGQRVPIMRPRVRQCSGKELPLGTYQLSRGYRPPRKPCGAISCADSACGTTSWCCSSLSMPTGWRRAPSTHRAGCNRIRW